MKAGKPVDENGMKHSCIYSRSEYDSHIKNALGSENFSVELTSISFAKRLSISIWCTTQVLAYLRIPKTNLHHVDEVEEKVKRPCSKPKHLQKNLIFGGIYPGLMYLLEKKPASFHVLDYSDLEALFWNVLLYFQRQGYAKKAF